MADSDWEWIDRNVVEIAVEIEGDSYLVEGYSGMQSLGSWDYRVVSSFLFWKAARQAMHQQGDSMTKHSTSPCFRPTENFHSEPAKLLYHNFYLPIGTLASTSPTQAPTAHLFCFHAVPQLFSMYVLKMREIERSILSITECEQSSFLLFKFCFQFINPSGMQWAV